MNRIKRLLANLSTEQKIIEGVSLLISIAGIVTSIKMNLVGHSLWYDEAALAYSFCTRGLGGLTGSGLELVQSAPVGWLYLEKVFVEIAGNTDFNLRILSVVFYILMLLEICYVMKAICKAYYVFPAVSFVATIPLLLQYSNVFKPYIADAFFCLGVIILYDLYKRGKINVYVLALLWVIVIWFSSPGCFIIGGCILTDFIFEVVARKKRNIFDIIKVALIVLAGFVVYYIYWLSKVDIGMSGWWQDSSFPLIPTSLEDLIRAKDLLHTLFKEFYRFEWLVLIFLIVALIYAIYKKDRIIIAIYLSLFLALFASFIGMYPINRRLWVFAYPLITVVIFSFINSCLASNKERITRVIAGVFVIILSLGNSGIYYYWDEQHVYWPGYEVKGEVEYLEDIIKADDKVYVLSCAAPMFLYYNDYDEEKLTGRSNRVLVGRESFSDKTILNQDSHIDHSSEYDYILGSVKCYIVASDSWDDEAQYGKLFDRLQNEGELEIVYNKYDTPLLLFKKR